MKPPNSQSIEVEECEALHSKNLAISTCRWGWYQAPFFGHIFGILGAWRRGEGWRLIPLRNSKGTSRKGYLEKPEPCLQIVVVKSLVVVERVLSFGIQMFRGQFRSAQVPP